MARRIVIVSGDADLLALNPFRDIPVSRSSFCRDVVARNSNDLGFIDCLSLVASRKSNSAITDLCEYGEARFRGNNIDSVTV